MVAKQFLLRAAAMLWHTFGHPLYML